MRLRGWPLFLLPLLALPSLLACHQNESAKYAGAAVTAGLAVAAAAVNRAATDECWGDCSPGFGCDEKTGLCVPIDELEDDPRPEWTDDEDDGCIVEDDGRRVCPDDPVADEPATDDADPDDTAHDGGGGAGGANSPTDRGGADSTPSAP